MRMLQAELEPLLVISLISHTRSSLSKAE